MAQILDASLQAVLVIFENARSFYLKQDFKQAREVINEYQKLIDYSLFPIQENRNLTKTVESSVVLVSYGSGIKLIDCIQSLQKQHDDSFEIIVVDNGKNENVYSQLASLPILWIKSPINLLPSEGRNLGASFARGKWLIFLDDDALVEGSYTKIARTTMESGYFIAIRGKVLPKKQDKKTEIPKHYDLGNRAIPSELTVEGNMVMQRQTFMDIGGFDPLMFGHEGKEITWRCQYFFPHKNIFYWPLLRIKHNFAEGERLKNKIHRQNLGFAYLNYLNNNKNTWKTITSLNKVSKKKSKNIKKITLEDKIQIKLNQSQEILEKINAIKIEIKRNKEQSKPNSIIENNQDEFHQLIYLLNKTSIEYKDICDDMQELRVYRFHQ